MKRFSLSQTALDLTLIGLVALLAYAPVLWQAGYFKEDWYIIWSGITRGPGAFIPMFMSDRPLEGYLFAALFPLLKSGALPWHIFALLVRAAGAMLVYALLTFVWPRKKEAILMASLLFLVYPGFAQQAQAISFQVHFVALLLALISLALTLYAARKFPAQALTGYDLLALPLIPAYLLLMEYYIGLEAIRLLLIGVILSPAFPSRPPVRLLLRRWAAYLAVTGSYLIWRLFFFAGTRATTNIDSLVDAYVGGGMHRALQLAIEGFRDLFETILLAWSVPLHNHFYWGTYSELAGKLGLVLLAVVIVAWRLQRWSTQGPAPAETRGALEQPPAALWRDPWVWGGLLATLLGLLPVLLANRDVQFWGREDRFALPASLGVAILVTGLLFGLFKRQHRRWVFLLLLGTAVYHQLNSGAYLSDFWQVQRNFWWQVTWRAPQLAPDTVLMVNLPEPYSLGEGYETWAPANILYYPDQTRPVILGQVLYQSTIADVIFGANQGQLHRGILLEMDYRDVLIASQASNLSCVNLINGQLYELSNSENPAVRLVAPYSQIERILVDRAGRTPPPAIFGDEPEHGWCYYYQSMSLARQRGDWLEAGRLLDEALAQGFKPYDIYEWLPALEVYVVAGREAEARNVAAIIKTEPAVRNSFCVQIDQAITFPAGYPAELILAYLCQ